MTNEPVNLDERRAAAAQKAIEQRRLARETQLASAAVWGADRRRLREQQLFAAPARSWCEAVAKAQYLLELLADTEGVRNPRLQALIDLALDDFVRLGESPKEEGR